MMQRRLPLRAVALVSSFMISMLFSGAMLQGAYGAAPGGSLSVQMTRASVQQRTEDAAAKPEPRFQLLFPLANLDPYRACIVSIFDHFMEAQHPYCPDNIVEAYTGETGVIQGPEVTSLANDCDGDGVDEEHHLYGYKKADKSEFTLICNYAYSDSLYYDGNPGYDYPVPDGTDVFAAEDGDIVFSNWEKGEGWTLKIDHDGGIYQTSYAHLSEFVVKSGHVSRGQLIARSGKSGDKLDRYQLHFRVSLLKAGIPVDPYGWKDPSKPDDYGPENIRLWDSRYLDPGSCTPIAYPDLVVENVSVNPKGGTAGSRVKINVTVRNRGAAPAASSLTRIRLSTGAEVTTGDRLLDFFEVPSLASKQAISFSRTVKIPSNSPMGAGNIHVTANADGGVAECNASNNVRWVSFALSAVTADLTPLGVNKPANGFTSQAANLSAPTLKQPPNGRANQLLAPVFKWTSVSGATSYRIMVATSAGVLPLNANEDACAGCVINDTSVKNAYTAPAEMLGAGTTYWWQVKGGNTSQFGEWSAQSSFTTATPDLAAPTLKNPSNGMKGQSTTPGFSWSSVPYATFYRIMVATTAGDLPRDMDADTCAGCVINDTPTGASYTPAPGMLNAGATYWWQVKAQSPFQRGRWSTPFSFITRDPDLPPPTLLNPSNGATDESLIPAFTWSTIPNATSYRIMVATTAGALPSNSEDFACTACVINATSTGTAYSPVAGLSPGTTYWWQVKGRSSSQFGEWSTKFSFTTGNPDLSPPTLFHPADGSTDQSKTPAFTWSAISGATSYRIMVATSAGALPGSVDEDTCAGCVINATPTGTSYVPGAGVLSPGTTYWWQVKGGNVSQFGEWSTQFSFTTAGSGTIDLPQPGLKAPRNESTNQSTRPSFSWSSVPGATFYRIMVATSAGALPGSADEDTCAGCVINATTNRTAYTPPAVVLSPGTIYWWQVKGGNTMQFGEWSEQFGFDTASVPSSSLPPPSLLGPPNAGEYQSTTPTLVWSDLSDATSYRIMVATSPGVMPRKVNADSCDHCVLNTTTTDPFLALSVALNPGTTYWWQVKGRSPSQFGEWSLQWSFTTLN